MLKLLYKYILIVVFFLSHIVFSQNENAKDSIKANIKLIKKDNLVTIYAEAINHSQILQSELNYVLLSLKKDTAGNLSKNVQSGEFSLRVDETKTLSRQQLNIHKKDNLKIYLYLKRNKQLISKDSINISLVDKKYSNTAIDEINMELSGLIVENTMTKLGKDFYDFFNQINQLNNTKYPFIIIINEKPALGGRNSEISIVIHNNTIYKFRTQPKSEYLYAHAKEASKRIYKYHLKNKLLKSKERMY